MITSRARKRSYENLFFRIKIFFKIFSFILLASSLFWVVAKIREIQYFPIKQVNVYGAKHSDPAVLQALIKPMINRGFFSVDVDSIKEQLKQSSWVTDASVQRVWPDKVAVILNERAPFARWNNTALLSDSGELFSANMEETESLPRFVGPDGEHIHMLDYYKKINSILLPLHIKISRLELTASTWKLTFDNGIKLDVGYRDVLTHIGHFVKVYPKIVGNRAADVEYVDLRYPNGLAIRWKSHITLEG
jgi:cell division protein FtsQ